MHYLALGFTSFVIFRSNFAVIFHMPREYLHSISVGSHKTSDASRTPKEPLLAASSKRERHSTVPFPFYTAVGHFFFWSL